MSPGLSPAAPPAAPPPLPFDTQAFPGIATPAQRATPTPGGASSSTFDEIRRREAALRAARVLAEAEAAVAERAAAEAKALATLAEEQEARMAELREACCWEEREASQRAARETAHELQVSALSDMTGVGREVCEDVLSSWGGDVDAALEALLALTPEGYMPPPHNGATPNGGRPSGVRPHPNGVEDEDEDLRRAQELPHSITSTTFYSY